MAQQQSDLPEGTDQVIRGAMNTDSSNDKTSSSQASGGRSGASAALMDKVRSSGGKLSEQAAGKARDFLGQGLERSAEALSNISRLIGDTASGLDDRLGEDYGNYARRTAQTLENTAGKLAEKNPDELIDDTRNFIRKSPGVALAGAAIAGFAIARLLKSGLGQDEDDGDDGGRGRSRG